LVSSKIIGIAKKKNMNEIPAINIDVKKKRNDIRLSLPE
jgi:hypothetical protein